jgi:hypothetical protein|nr:MAG TPA: hypothetical protein [Caudoviricetes sp.]
MNPVVKILMERDNMTEQGAIDLVRKTKEELMNRPCSDGADIIMDNLGLEPDYIMDILKIDRGGLKL